MDWSIIGFGCVLIKNLITIDYDTCYIHVSCYMLPSGSINQTLDLLFSNNIINKNPTGMQHENMIILVDILYRFLENKYP